MELLFDPDAYGITEIFRQYLFPIPDTDQCRYPVWVQKVGEISEEEYSEITGGGEIEILHQEVKDERGINARRLMDVDGPPMMGDEFFNVTTSSRGIVARKL